MPQMKRILTAVQLFQINIISGYFALTFVCDLEGTVSIDGNEHVLCQFARTVSELQLTHYIWSMSIDLLL